MLLQVQLQVPLAPARGQQPRHPDRVHGQRVEEVGKIDGEEELRGGGDEVPVSGSGDEERTQSG